MFNLPYVCSAIIYDDIITKNAGSHANVVTLTINSETLRANIYGEGLSMLNAKGLNTSASKKIAFIKVVTWKTLW